MRDSVSSALDGLPLPDAAPHLTSAYSHLSLSLSISLSLFLSLSPSPTLSISFSLSLSLSPNLSFHLSLPPLLSLSVFQAVLNQKFTDCFVLVFLDAQAGKT